MRIILIAVTLLAAFMQIPAILFHIAGYIRFLQRTDWEFDALSCFSWSFGILGNLTLMLFLFVFFIRQLQTK